MSDAAEVYFPSHPVRAGDDVSREALAEACRNIRADLEGLVPTLAALGYRFRPDPIIDLNTSTYGATGRSTYEAVAQEPPPVTLDLWWEIVGPVDLTGDFTALIPESTQTRVDYNNGRYLDALFVDDVDSAVRGIRIDVENKAVTYGYVEVAPDFVTKAGYGGAGPVGFHLPASADPVLVDDNQVWPHGLTFTEMVRVSMSWAGLPGLRNFHFIPPELDDLLDHFGRRYGRLA